MKYTIHREIRYRICAQYIMGVKQIKNGCFRTKNRLSYFSRFFVVVRDKSFNKQKLWNKAPLSKSIKSVETKKPPLSKGGEPRKRWRDSE